MTHITALLAREHVFCENNKPSVKNVEKFLALWEDEKNYEMRAYVFQEETLIKIFHHHPQNNTLNIDNVTKTRIVGMKCRMVDTYYSTNLKDSFSPIVTNILSPTIKFDEKISQNNIDLVYKISQTVIRDEQARNCLSFASKYCSWHKPDVYPIYDKFVREMLWYLNQQYDFAPEMGNRMVFLQGTTNSDTYPNFKKVLDKFIMFFDLKKYSYKQIDRYLWTWAKFITNGWSY